MRGSEDEEREEGRKKSGWGGIDVDWGFMGLEGEGYGGGEIDECVIV